MVRTVIAAVLLLVGIVLAVKLLLQRKRLRDLAESMEDYLSRGGEPAPFSLREDTVAPVENAASELENRIAVLTERLREENERTSSLTADISHQLKTPLASLRLFVEMDESAHMSEELGQIERMEKLIGSLLRLEKLCADGYEFTFSEQAVRPLIENAWESLHALWPDKHLEIEGDASLRCDGKWLGEALQNLLKNACEHTAADGCIWVKIEQTEHTVYCSVEDNGGGVREKDLPHLFERFYRSEDQAQSGSGLGLAIVKEIAVRHHGHVSAENTKKGLRINLELPILNLTKT
ncbi:MAG: HAMP domain-containing histidine kinase [Oscillospiraceae bacterium]|nr:HAMP domain-containing histidine kinase [Oscillospiraceae bacterium]